MHTRFLVILLTFTCLCTSACVTLKQHNRLAGKVRALEKFQRDTGIALKRDTDRMENLKLRVDSAVKKLRQSGASLSAKVDGDADDVRMLKGRLEEVEYLANQMNALTTAMQKFVDERFGVSLTALPRDLPKEPEGMFGYAQNLYKANKFEQCRAVLRHFIRQHGEDERTPKVMLLLGESYRHQRRFRQAMKEYHEVWKQFSDKPEAPTALWYTAMALKQEGQCLRAKQMYKFVRRSYRKAPEAEKAKNELQNLKCKK